MKRIYVAEDEPLLGKLMQDFLKLRGDYDVRLFSDGLEAYEKALEDPPDVLVLDVILPSLSGLVVARLLKYHHEHCKIPIILISGITEDGIRETAIKAGADAFLKKPFDMESLAGQFEKLLSQASSPDGDLV